MINDKRFQDCNWLEKIFRYRYYVLIPFKYIWYMYINDFIVRETNINKDSGYIQDTDNIYNPKGKELLELLKGSAQCDMKWYYTSDEVFRKINNKFSDL